jgi:hypothetical protein
MLEKPCIHEGRKLNKIGNVVKKPGFAHSLLWICRRFSTDAFFLPVRTRSAGRFAVPVVLADDPRLDLNGVQSHLLLLPRWQRSDIPADKSVLATR